MIESSIRNALIADATLVSLIKKYRGRPAVFSRLAPESAPTPYVTFNLTRTETSGDIVLHDFVLMIDAWDYGSSIKIAGEISERIEYVFDNKQFTHERYSSIRIWLFSGGWVEDDDPRVIHYNQQFTVRACRKKWIDQL